MNVVYIGKYKLSAREIHHHVLDFMREDKRVKEKDGNFRDIEGGRKRLREGRGRMENERKGHI